MVFALIMYLDVTRRMQNLNEISYFDKCQAFQEKVDKLGKKILNKKIQVKLCQACPHKQDQHEMNCIECCPVKRSLEKQRSVKNG